MVGTFSECVDFLLTLEVFKGGRTEFFSLTLPEVEAIDLIGIGAEVFKVAMEEGMY